MKQDNIQSVSIEIGNSLYNRFEDFPSTVSHDLAEFIDNALQSYKDNYARLKELDSTYKLKVEIDIEWDDSERKRAKSISIKDNAAGIEKSKYVTAFKPGNTPENNTGLNEFGMGLKTAACWFGNSWTAKTKALGETVERTIHFSLNDVTIQDLKTLPVEEVATDINAHYTTIKITDLTKNAPAYRSLVNIKSELASIYRMSLRNREMEIYVCGESLSFIEPEILVAPFVRTPDAEPILWKKEIAVELMGGKYRAKGFIGILRTMNKTQNRIVLMRRGRVIVGADTEGQYYSRHISGQSGSPRDKRIFGELELEGFQVTFNKNDVQDKDNLEALMEAVNGVIHTKEFDLTTQAQEYREDERTKQIKRIVKKHNTSQKTNRSPIVVNTVSNSDEVSMSTNIDTNHGLVAAPSVVLGEYEDSYKINGQDYTLKVVFMKEGKKTGELFWVDVSEKNNNIIACQINTQHIYFEHFGKPDDASIALLKTMAIAKFAAKNQGNDTAADMFNFFNDFIKETKV